MNWLRSALLAFSLIGGLAGHAKEPPPGAGVDSSIPVNILLSIDNSSSMNNSTKRIKAPETMPMDVAGSGDGSWHLAHGASISRYEMTFWLSVPLMHSRRRLAGRFWFTTGAIQECSGQE